MKTFTRVIAVVMMVAVLASLMVACGGAKKEENRHGNGCHHCDIDHHPGMH